MDQDSKRKGKEPESSTTTTQPTITDDQTPPHASPPHSSNPQPSSSSADQELTQEAKRLKLSTPDPTPTPTPSPPSSPRINLSSIPPSHRRPFFNPPSASQRTHHSIETTVLVAASSSGSVSSNDHNLAASLRLMKPTERAEFRLESQGKQKRRKKRRRGVSESEARRARLARPPPGPSPLKPGLTPYQKVQKVLAELKDFIKILANEDTSKEHPPLPDPPLARATLSPSSSRPVITRDHIIQAASVSLSSSSSKAVKGAPEVGCSSSAATEEDDDDEDRWTVEEVIEMLEEFLTRVPRTIGAQEMENGLLEIQTSFGVSPSPTWYALMCRSYEDVWDSLIDYFDCDALNNLLEDVIEKVPSGDSGAGPSSTPSV